jgi:hypothetical protein
MAGGRQYLNSREPAGASRGRMVIAGGIEVIGIYHHRR